MTTELTDSKEESYSKRMLFSCRQTSLNCAKLKVGAVSALLYSYFLLRVSRLNYLNVILGCFPILSSKACYSLAESFKSVVGLVKKEVPSLSGGSHDVS